MSSGRDDRVVPLAVISRYSITSSARPRRYRNRGHGGVCFEDEVKKKFIEEPANMRLLIVVDKLLTGFDAPSCT
jgi:hypothetical protein